jgi:hypothetical protein
MTTRYEMFPLQKKKREKSRMRKKDGRKRYEETVGWGEFI